MRLRDQVVDVLREGGYQELSDVLNVASATFRFDFVMWSSDAGFNLIVGTAAEGDLPRRLAALARALDYVGSKASLTVVIEGTKLGPKLRSEVSQFARVLIVRPESLEDDLRVLLPLHLERRSVTSVDAIADMRKVSAGDPLVGSSDLLTGFTQEEQVRDSLRAFVAGALV